MNPIDDPEVRAAVFDGLLTDWLLSQMAVPVPDDLDRVTEEWRESPVI